MTKPRLLFLKKASVVMPGIYIHYLDKKRSIFSRPLGDTIFSNVFLCFQIKSLHSIFQSLSLGRTSTNWRYNYYSLSDRFPGHFLVVYLIFFSEEGTRSTLPGCWSILVGMVIGFTPHTNENYSGHDRKVNYLGNFISIFPTNIKI